MNMSTPTLDLDKQKKLIKKHQLRADKYKTFLAAIGSQTCTNTTPQGKACGHLGQAHASLGSCPCTLCDCMGFKADKAAEAEKK
jgi:hypothetical protein